MNCPHCGNHLRIVCFQCWDRICPICGEEIKLVGDKDEEEKEEDTTDN